MNINIRLIRIYFNFTLPYNLTFILQNIYFLSYFNLKRSLYIIFAFNNKWKVN